MWRGKGGRDKRQKEKDSVTERDRVGERRERGRGKNVEGGYGYHLSLSCDFPKQYTVCSNLLEDSVTRGKDN